jgi:hypothetical protein
VVLAVLHHLEAALMVMRDLHYLVDLEDLILDHTLPLVAVEAAEDIMAAVEVQAVMMDMMAVAITLAKDHRLVEAEQEDLVLFIPLQLELLVHLEDLLIPIVVMLVESKKILEL